MLWVCIVFLHVLNVLAGATSDHHPVFRRYPAREQKGGASRFVGSTSGDDADCDRDKPVYFRLESLHLEPTERDCLRCMVPRLEMLEDPDLCSCLPCSFKITPGDARLPAEIADNLFRLKCNSPCESEEQMSDTRKYLDLFEALMRSNKKGIEKPVAEAKISKKEFTPLGRRTNGNLPGNVLHCPNQVCEDTVPPRLVHTHIKNVNNAPGEKVSEKNVADRRSGTVSRYGPLVTNDKSRSGLGTYNMPYPKPTFLLPAKEATSPHKGKTEEIKFRTKTRRNESDKTHNSEEKKSHDNKNQKEKLPEALKPPKAENLSKGEEQKPKNPSIALAIAADQGSSLVISDSQNPSTGSEEHVNISAKKSKIKPEKSTTTKPEEAPEHEADETVDITEFDVENTKTPITTEHYPIREEESTTVEAYPTTTENTSEEEIEEFSDVTKQKGTMRKSPESTEQPREGTENLHSDNEEMDFDLDEWDEIGYRRSEETTTVKPEKTTGAEKERVQPKIVIEISDAKNTSKPGLDGVINMKVDVYSKGDLGNVYRFLSRLIPPKFQSEKEIDSAQLKSQPLLDPGAEEYA